VDRIALQTNRFVRPRAAPKVRRCGAAQGPTQLFAGRRRRPRGGGRAALDKRRQSAEERKRTILASLAERDVRRRAGLDQREQLRVRQEAAEREQQELEKLEARLKRDEQHLRELRKQDEENIRLAAAESEREVKSRLERSELPDRPFTQKLTKKTIELRPFSPSTRATCPRFSRGLSGLGRLHRTAGSPSDSSSPSWSPSGRKASDCR
jgi:hypothetical protein